MATTRGASSKHREKALFTGKAFFRAALRRRLIRENPFSDMKTLMVGASPQERVKDIDAETANGALDACPDASWRAIVALARYGGPGVPYEIRPL